MGYQLSVRHFIFFVLIAFVLSACEAEATPVVETPIPTETPVVIPTDIPTIRYGLLDNTVGYLDNSDQLGLGTEITLVTVDEDLSGYDMVAGYGIVEGMTSVSIGDIVVILNTQKELWQDDVIREQFWASIDRDILLETLDVTGFIERDSFDTLSSDDIRTTIANMGYPDGFELLFGIEPFHAQDEAIRQWSNANFRITSTAVTDDWRDRFDDEQLHGIIIWHLADDFQLLYDEFGEANVRRLYQVTMSYRVNEGIAHEFNERNFPYLTLETE